MISRISRWLYPVLLQREQTQSEHALRHERDEARAEAESLKRTLAQREAELEEQMVKNRIQQTEVEHLAAVCARDLERVRQERDVYVNERQTR